MQRLKAHISGRPNVEWPHISDTLLTRRHSGASGGARSVARDMVCRIFKCQTAARCRMVHTHTCVRVCVRAYVHRGNTECNTRTSLYRCASCSAAPSPSLLGLIEIYEIVLAPAGQSRLRARVGNSRRMHACTHACQRRCCTAHMPSVHVYCASGHF